MDLIVLALFVWAFHSAYLHVTGQLRTSRKARVAEREKQIAPKTMSKTQRKVTAARHDTGWLLREAVHGFPVARYGWRTGWVAHKAVHEQHKALHEQHRGVLASIRAARQQGKQNVQAVEDDRQPLSRKELKDKFVAASPPAQPGEQQAVPAAPASPLLPPAAGSASPPVAGVPPQTDPVPDPAPATSNGVPMPTGTTATAETTYTQDISKCNKIIVACDIEGARLRAEQMVAWVEDMVAAGLNAKHTGMAADLSDRIEQQIKANQQTHDQAEALKDSIIRDHHAGHDYHSSAPDGGASREYLRD